MIWLMFAAVFALIGGVFLSCINTAIRALNWMTGAVGPNGETTSFADVSRAAMKGLVCFGLIGALWAAVVLDVINF